MFSEMYCRNLDYEFRTKLEGFRFEAFKKAFFRKTDKPIAHEGVLFSAVASSAKEEDDYHAHFSWNVMGNNIRLEVEYYGTSRKKAPDEREPFADGVMSWLGGFFEKGQARAHVDAIFVYPRAKWQLILPLPITVPLGDIRDTGIEVDGMSLSLPKNSTFGGMNKVWLTSMDTEVRTILHGNRTVQFAGFDLRADLEDLLKYGKMFVREVANDRNPRKDPK